TFSRDWSSDVCSSDLQRARPDLPRPARHDGLLAGGGPQRGQLRGASGDGGALRAQLVGVVGPGDPPPHAGRDALSQRQVAAARFAWTDGRAATSPPAARPPPAATAPTDAA